MERKRLPALAVPPAGYDLLDDFAHTNKMSISEAVRVLLQESPRLIQYANEIGRSVDVLSVGEWGGSRGIQKDTDAPSTTG